MNPIEKLKAVLCDPDGIVRIDGSEEDRTVIQEALHELDQIAARSATCGRIADLLKGRL